MGERVALEGGTLAKVKNPFLRTITILALGCCVLPPSLTAQNDDKCFFLCRPELKIEPTFTVENIFSRHRVAEMEGDEQVSVTRAEREVVFETIFALDIPTEIPRVGFTFETIFLPSPTTTLPRWRSS